MDEKSRSALVLGSYLDTLGFNNGIWEFNFNYKVNTLYSANMVTNHIVHHFFALGGYSINISKWNASDDTILMLATMRACMKGDKIEYYINEYIKILPLLEQKKRYSGINTINTLNLLKKTKNLDKIPFSNKMGGNGAAIRTAYIGLHYFDNLDKLIEMSIQSSRLTHNYPMGFLGGFVTALFTSYAYKNIKPWKWCDKLLELYESGKINNFLKTTNIYEKYNKVKDDFWSYWYKYRENRLSKFYLKPKEFLYAADRTNDLINYCPEFQFSDDKNYNYYGSSGVSATIIAYDSLLLSIVSDTKIVNLDENIIKYSFENLIYFSTLHFGDNDSIGCIAGCWFGALTGFKYYDSKIAEQLEFKI
uniref:ADP-ribosylglycohydrolase n=1 Tax=Megaviridae environmental sample TaxID=1737588 RepID=A0A5J6VKQ5_9VIRU|nr:MAG: ADP-ribosylglycohydrolase [Megaviridae environmental sample]